MEAAVKFEPMRDTLADIWHPLGGVNIKDLGGGRYLFRFFYKVDIQCIIPRGPWTFNNHILVLYRLREDENPWKVDLFKCLFWVQVHSLLVGCFS